MEQFLQKILNKDDADKPKLDDVKLYHLSEDNHIRVENVLSKYPEILEGTLCEVNSMEHHIELKPGMKPNFLHPYRAGPKKRVVSKAKID